MAPTPAAGHSPRGGTSYLAGIADGVNGFTAPSDPGGCADALTAVLADERRREKVGEAARRDLAEPWEEVARDLFPVYGRLMSGKALAGVTAVAPRYHSS